MKFHIRFGGYAINNLIHTFQRFVLEYLHYCIRHKRSTFRTGYSYPTCYSCDQEQFTGFLKEVFK